MTGRSGNDLSQRDGDSHSVEEGAVGDAKRKEGKKSSRVAGMDGSGLFAVVRLDLDLLRL